VKLVANELAELLDSSEELRTLPAHDALSLVKGVFEPPVEVQAVPPVGVVVKTSDPAVPVPLPAIAAVKAPSVGVVLTTARSATVNRTSRRSPRPDGRVTLSMRPSIATG
jgi:hypothetical protein